MKFNYYKILDQDNRFALILCQNGSQVEGRIVDNETLDSIEQFDPYNKSSDTVRALEFFDVDVN